MLTHSNQSKPTKSAVQQQSQVQIRNSNGTMTLVLTPLKSAQFEGCSGPRPLLNNPSDGRIVLGIGDQNRDGSTPQQENLRAEEDLSKPDGKAWIGLFHNTRLGARGMDLEYVPPIIQEGQVIVQLTEADVEAGCEIWRTVNKAQAKQQGRNKGKQKPATQEWKSNVAAIVVQQPIVASYAQKDPMNNAAPQGISKEEGWKVAT
ncbi:hypothetical protein RND71_025637 [Anisodus tanguticus]|uniref:Uncharacterized protein n=1 Tax=Anisodus tanguticus TaxID=243964 RepID=A0AAE1VAK3_9SOLA|nr:hypothetical protein RND71_025637 [Anisodus tanguticus]